jgi:cytoskeletal protein RodZ
MPDEKRVDLSSSLNEISADLLNDVKAAAAEVKQQQEAAAKRNAKDADQQKSKKSMTLVVAASAVVLILIAYWMFFARPNNYAGNASPAPSTSSTKVTNPVSEPTTQKQAPVVAPQPTNPTPVGRDPQVTDHPSDDYEQPSGGGM